MSLFKSPGARRRARDARALPRLEWNEHFQFPHPTKANDDGIVGVGGNLSPGILLSAYRQGIFPWFNDDSPVLWWSPDPRFMLLPEELHISGTMKKFLKKEPYRLSLDRAFERVISHCSLTPRPGQNGTWITDDMLNAYTELHALGFAHSVEAWLGDRLVGGLYGIALGSAFFGESMFSLEPDASKVAFIPLVLTLREAGFSLIDSQVRTDHVASMGGREIPRQEYLERLSAALATPENRQPWHERFPDFPDSAAYRVLTHKGPRSGQS